MALSHPTLLLLVSLILAIKAQEHQQQQQHQQIPEEDMQARMQELVKTVQDTVGSTDKAIKSDKFVDLGESLKMLETKFSALREALATELGAKTASIVLPSTTSSKELMDQSSVLVQRIITQRDELSSLASDIAQVDSAVRSIRESLTVFEHDADDLNGMVKDLHVHHEEIEIGNKDAKMAMDEMSTSRREKNKSSSHIILSILLLGEVALFVGFLYMKSNGGLRSHKALAKFG